VWTKEEEGTRREKREIKRINGEAPAKRNAGTRRRQPSPLSLHPSPPVPPLPSRRHRRRPRAASPALLLES